MPQDLVILMRALRTQLGRPSDGDKVRVIECSGEL